MIQLLASVKGLHNIGDRHRNNVFWTCGGLLLLTFLVVKRYLVD
jgi:hypothetical protein